MRLALKFGYDGRQFHGFSRQPGQRTVEGDILGAFEQVGVLEKAASPREIRYAAASRTDAGVSAIGNVIALDTSFRTDALLPAINARLDCIWFHSKAEVPEDFRPRQAALRWYRYHLRAEEALDVPKLKKALRLFKGTHDFTNFSRPEGETAVRTVQELRVRRSGPFITVDIFAQSFLWNMVRRIVGAAMGVSCGDIALGQVQTALRAPRRKADLGLANPEGLVLMDVVYDIEFIRDDKAYGLACRQLEKKSKEALETLVVASYFSGLPAIRTSP